MSIMSIVLPYDYICSNSKITWKDIHYGIERKYLQPKAAIEHAMKLISESDEYDEKTLELASLSFEESIFPLLDQIVETLTESNIEELNDKWLFLILKWVYEHKEELNDPLTIVEYVYSDFDAPNQISNLIRYNPTDEPNLGSKELNEARMIEKWKKFIEQQKEIYLDLSNAY
ncbi:MAG: DUF2247 family protein [Aminipila sp.]